MTCFADEEKTSKFLSSVCCIVTLFSFSATQMETSRTLTLTEQKCDLKKSLVLQLLLEKHFEVAFFKNISIRSEHVRNGSMLFPLYDEYS